MRASNKIDSPQALIVDYCFDPKTGQVNICELGSLFSGDRGFNGAHTAISNLTNKYQVILLESKLMTEHIDREIIIPNTSSLDVTDSVYRDIDRHACWNREYYLHSAKYAAQGIFNQIKIKLSDPSKEYCLVASFSMRQEEKIYVFMVPQELRELLIQENYLNVYVLNSDSRTAAISENKFYFMSYQKDKPLNCLNIRKPAKEKIKKIQEKMGNDPLVIKPVDNAEGYGVNVIPGNSLSKNVDFFKDLIEFRKSSKESYRTETMIPVFKRHNISLDYLKDRRYIGWQFPSSPYMVMQPLFPTVKAKKRNATIRTFFTLYPDGSFEEHVSFMKLADEPPVGTNVTNEAIISSQSYNPFYTVRVPPNGLTRMLPPLKTEILKIYSEKPFVDHITGLLSHDDEDIKEAADFYSKKFLTEANGHELTKKCQEKNIKYGRSSFVPEVECTYAFPDPGEGYFPESYHDVTSSHYDLFGKAKSILSDYTKKDSIWSGGALFFSLHWNRHYIDEVNKILDTAKDFAELSQKLESIKIENKSGSLAKRMEFIDYLTYPHNMKPTMERVTGKNP